MRRTMVTTLIAAILAPGLVLAGDEDDFWEEQEEFLEEQQERQEELWNKQREREEDYRRQINWDQSGGGWYGADAYAPMPYSAYPSYPPRAYHGDRYQYSAPYYPHHGTSGSWYAPSQPFPSYSGGYGGFGFDAWGAYPHSKRYGFRRGRLGGWLNRYGAGPFGF